MAKRFWFAPTVKMLKMFGKSEKLVQNFQPEFQNVKSVFHLLFQMIYLVPDSPIELGWLVQIERADLNGISQLGMFCLPFVKTQVQTVSPSQVNGKQTPWSTEV